jgi:hypothetical protein
MKMEFHEAAGIFPMIDDEDYEAFRQDIKERGLKEPIVTYKGKIIDGRNRFKACRDLGIKPVYVEWDGDGTITEQVVSLNLHRRHLETGQRALLGAKIAEMLRKEAHERQGTRTDLMESISGGTSTKNLVEVGAERRAGKAAHVSHFNVTHGVKVLKHGIPELVDAINANQVEVSNAAAISSLPPEEQKAIVGAGPEAMRAKAQEIKGEKAAAKAPAEKVAIVLKGKAAVRKYLDKLVDEWAKVADTTEVTPEQVCELLQKIRADLCGE